MYKYKRKLLSIILTLFCGYLVAQDIHFTQYYASPLSLNPANTGFYEGDCRISGMYRTQWKAVGGEPYNTISLAFDKPYYIYSEKLNYGLIFINDNSGVVGLHVNKIFLSLSYSKIISGHELQIGIQPGYVNKSTKMDEYSFDEQFTLGGDEVFGGDFTGEGGSNSLSYFDLNAGILWSKQLTAKLKPSAGFSLFHITTPYESFDKIKTDASKLSIRWIFHASAIWKLGKKLRAVPNLLYMSQKGATDFLIGGNVEIDIQPKTIKTVYVGTLFRYGWGKNYDASAWIAGVKFGQFDFGASYDINISSLSEATNNRGALEFSLTYICKSTKPQTIKIPCDRY